MKPTQPLKRKKVIAADDNRLFRLMLKDILEGAGYDVVLAADGVEALEEVRKAGSDTDLLILDLLMPRLTGFDVIRDLRGDPATRDLPILAVTEYYTAPEEIQKVRSIGATGYIRKSSGPEEILFRVSAILKPFGKEQRQSTRVPVSIPITFDHGGHCATCRTFNLGADGCFIITRDIPPIGADIDVTFWLPNATRILKCRGKVAWSRALGTSENDSLPPGIGVEFPALPADVSDPLRQFVKSQIQENLSEIG